MACVRVAPTEERYIYLSFLCRTTAQVPRTQKVWSIFFPLLAPVPRSPTMSAFDNFESFRDPPPVSSQSTNDDAEDDEVEVPKRELKKQKAGDPADFSFLDMQFGDRGAAASAANLFCAPAFDGMMLGQQSGQKSHTKNGPALEEEEEAVGNMDSEHHDYIRENCLKDNSELKTFKEIVGVPHVVSFAQQYEPVVTGARRVISGLLLFGPSGTGKTASAQAIASYIGSTFYEVSGSDLPNGMAGAKRIDALFDVVMSGPLPAVIFFDEADGLFSARATHRVTHFARKFARFMQNLLIIAATNEPTKIAPKILTGRFERKILIDNPNAAARRALINRQLAQEEHESLLSTADLSYIIDQTAGRSAVNMERLVSTAVTKAGGMPVGRVEFEDALEEEPSDYDAIVATANAKYDHKHGWHGGGWRGCSLPS